MDFEGYKTKIQKASSLIEVAKCPEDILNNKEYDIANDFQYICLSSNINSDLVNEVIARLAQNGNQKIVEDNIKEISMGMWKYLFNKNEAIKEIFINNFEKIIENAGILTYREIENFINDDETISCVYDNFKIIIKKLCTYDRAAVIANIKTKENGVEKIKEHIEQFFKKGEFDISTTYSKILIELADIPGITTIEILEACSHNLNEMLERETAIDNETNVLLSWIYDSMEETQMYNEQREQLQKCIDEAILANFDGILDKSNYDKETIKILKQFSCTLERFEGNKNLFIEKSNKLIHMTKIYDFNYDRANKEVENNFKTEDVSEDVSVEIKNNQLESIQEDTDDSVEVNEIDESGDMEININDFSDEVKSEVEALEEYAELIEQSGKTEDINPQDIINAIINGNLLEADKIIEKVMQREKTIEQNENKKISEDEEKYNNYECIVENENNHNYKGIIENENNEISSENNGEHIKEGLIDKSEIECQEKGCSKIYDEDLTVKTVNDEQAMILNSDNPVAFKKFVKVIKSFINKVKSIFSKYKIDKIGD